MKPILFNTEMVQAILDGRKTVTRRKIDVDITNFCDVDSDGTLLDYQNNYGEFVDPIKLCRYKVGDVLYVRETWAEWGELASPYQNRGNAFAAGVDYYFYYKADGKKLPDGLKWRPSIHMPKEAARIFLKVTDVKVERLQDISEEQAIKEGCIPIECTNCRGFGCSDCIGSGWEEPPLLEFHYLWNSTIKKKNLRYYSWEANPWVFIIEFEVIEK